MVWFSMPFHYMAQYAMGWGALLWGQAANILLLSVNVTPPEAVLNTLHGARSPLA